METPENTETSPQEPVKSESTTEMKEKKEAKMQSAPRHQGTLKMLPEKSFKDQQDKRLLESVKTWSYKVLKAQIESPRVSEEMKKACKEEFEKRYTK